MSPGTDYMLPRWLIDDSAGITNARVFAIHTQEPRLIGELLPEREAGLEGIQLTGLPYGEVLARIVWIDDPVFDADDLCRSLARAIEHHATVRNWT